MSVEFILFLKGRKENFELAMSARKHVIVKHPSF